MIVGVNGGEKYFKLKKISWINDITDWVEIDLTKIIYIDKEIPSGLIDGINDIFELSSDPIPNSEHLFLNGLLNDSLSIIYNKIWLIRITKGILKLLIEINEYIQIVKFLMSSILNSEKYDPNFLLSNMSSYVLISPPNINEKIIL